MRRLTLIALGLWLLSSAAAHAVFTKAEMDTVDPEPLLDSEYLLDLIGFSYPLDWIRDFETSKSSAAYRANGASLDCCALLFEQDVRLSRRLADKLSFRYDLRQMGDKELDDLHHWVSIEAGPWYGASIGLFGEPTPAKEDADIGLLLRHRPLPGVMVYAARNAVDWNFNHRGRTAAKYLKAPVTYEAGAELARGDDRWRAWAEWDLPLVRTDPAANLTYAYRRTTAALRWSRLPVEDSAAGFDLLYRLEYKKEGALYAPDPSLASRDFRRTAHFLRAGGVLQLGAKDRMEAGAGFWRRDARTDVPGGGAGNRRLLRWEAEPYARWLRRVAPWFQWESAVFLGSGETRQEFPNAPAMAVYERPVNAKLDQGAEFLFGERGRIAFRGSFDLDDLGRHLWDGGNIRVQLFF